MHVLVGTSGYSYKEWKGPFYPKEVPAARFLAFYAEHFATVEINNTFYRMPTAKLVDGWASEVPERFTFAIKAPQRITHFAKLKGAEETVGIFVRTVTTLGPRLGPLLFQLPPFMKKDVPLLADFLAAVRRTSSTDGPRIGFEFRHASWFDDETWAVLRRHGASLCIAEGEKLESPLVATADWGYVRLRRDAYPDDVIAAWAEKIRAQPWKEAFVYLKHDDGDAPSVARKLIARLGSG
jgi:uncharacterized protein YecE (DUF72 family)